MKTDNQLELLEAAIKLAIKYRLRSVKVGGLEATLSDLAFVTEPHTSQELDVKALTASQMPSDTDMLLWSTSEELPSEALIAAATAAKDAT